VSEPRELGLIALVAHAREVPSDAREAFAAAASAVALDTHAIVVRTCHRAELYLVDDPEGDERPPVVRVPDLPPGGYRMEGTAAARHLFAVAAGLDSVVVGEDQILHQLRECLAERHLTGLEACHPDRGILGMPAPDHVPGGLHPVLERLFQVALHIGRETRSWREGPPRSLADVALDRIDASTGLLDRRILVVGAGRMARLAALSAARRGARVLVANRSADRAAALAYDASGEPVAFGPDAPLPDCVGAVTAISGRWPLGPDARAELIASRIPVVDLSSPPALDPELRAALGEHFTSVDDLARAPGDPIRARFRRRYERLLDESEAAFMHWLRVRMAVPAIQALSDRAERRRTEELERLFRRVELLDHERELVEQMTHRLVAGILHAPLSALREDDSGDLERAARALFVL
jgi:glutamyl-tRNA reductase